MSSAGQAQDVAVKVNGLGLGSFAGFGQYSPTPNLGLEIALWPKWTLDIDGYWNPFKYSENKGTDFWGVQPELRYWFCNKFNGHFIGLHGQYVDYYQFGMKKYLYEGWFAGVGLSYGYSLQLGYRWKLEGNIGFGWNDVHHDAKWLRGNPFRPDMPYTNYGGPGEHKVYMTKDNQINPLGFDSRPEKINKDYWGITRAGISLIFVLW